MNQISVKVVLVQYNKFYSLCPDIMEIDNMDQKTKHEYWVFGVWIEHNKQDSTVITEVSTSITFKDKKADTWGTKSNDPDFFHTISCTSLICIRRPLKIIKTNYKKFLSEFLKRYWNVQYIFTMYWSVK